MPSATVAPPTPETCCSPEERSQRVLTLREVANKYLTDYKPRHAPKSYSYQEYAVKHLNEHLGDKLLTQLPHFSERDAVYSSTYGVLSSLSSEVCQVFTGFMTSAGMRSVA